jgi:DNA-binding SARP family transcriptional activator
LHDLLDRDLFISRTSGDTEWFRYHPLFREFLKNLLETEVSEEEIRDLHLKAGAWFTEQDEWQEGIYHAISAREFEKAADLLEEKTDDLIRSASADNLLYWIDRLPDAIQEKRAGILFAKGWALVLTGKWNEAYGLLGRAKEMAIREKDQPILGKTLYYLMALLYFQMSYKDIPGLAKEAGDHLDPCSPYLPELLRMLATSYMYMNRALKSRSVWEEIRENPVVQNDPVVRLRVMTLRGPHYYLPMGQFDKAVMELEEGIAYYRNHDHMGRYAQYKGYLGYVRHEMGYFKKSQDLFKETATSLRQGGNPLFLTFLYSGLIINAVILGDMKEAEAYFLKSREIQSRFDTSRLQKGHFVLIGSALLAVQKGDREGFFQKADSALKISETIGDYWDYYTVSGHLAPGYAFFGADQKARELLLTALVRAREIGAPYAEARSRLLIASLAHDRGDEGASAAHLESSLSIGEKHGYDFLFLNREYSAFLKLLPLALAGSFSADYLKTLIPRMEPEHAGPVLLGLLKNSDPVVKVQVLNLLSLCGVRDAEGAVRSLQKDPDRAVRESAGRVAKRLEALPPLPLKIRMFGPFRIFQGGREIREESWSRKKALAILKYLIFYQEKKIQTEILIETFYPDLPFDRAYESLRKVMSSLRTGLEPGLPSRKRSAYLNAGKGFYAFILPEKSDVDVFRFDSLLAAAQRSRAEDGPEHSLGGYEEAIKIWQGPFLEEDPYEPWTNLPRERYRSLYIDALREVSRQSFQSFDYGTCIEVLQKILDQDDWDEAAYLLLMKCHLALGDRTRAITTYRVCKQVLSRELQINPSKKLSDLYQSIIRD